MGLMNFNTMNWGYQDEGRFVGHNGLTYGFGSQSGYNYKLEFALSFVNNDEEFTGHAHHDSENRIYKTVASIVRKHRLRAGWIL